ncbi:MAG: isocitrate/isopropylmalate dehydrogenase family protein [Rhodothermaceae bacterium]
MAHSVTLIKGDGVGPEVAEATRRCIDATGVSIDWEPVEAGEKAIAESGTPLPDTVLDSIKNNKIALKAPIATPLGTGFRSVNVALRKELDLFACVRPCKYYPGVQSSLKNPEVVDIVIIRENTEDLYAGIEFQEGKEDTSEIVKFISNQTGRTIRPDSGISIKPISVFGTERIAKFAYEYAKLHSRKKVTAVTKSNIMKFSDGLFMQTAEKIGNEYKEIETGHVLVDALCMHLVMDPTKYDVLCLPNLYGDIISDLGAGLIGGLGVAPGANIGNDYAVFEATHGSAPDIAGKNLVNPTAMILSGVLMLKHLHEFDAAEKLENAVAAVIKEGKSVTADLKPVKNDPTAVGTIEMADAIINKM